jgi:hypothetical protein
VNRESFQIAKPKQRRCYFLVNRQFQVPNTILEKSRRPRNCSVAYGFSEETSTLGALSLAIREIQAAGISCTECNPFWA